MPVVPYDSNDTVVYNGADLYVPKDCSVTVFEDSRVFLFGEWYLNGQPLMSGSSPPSGQEVQVSPAQPTDAGIKLWFDTSAGYGELKVLTGGSWKTIEDPADALAADEVSIGVGQPSAPNYELWVDTNTNPSTLKAKVSGNWQLITKDEVQVGGSEPVDTNNDIWIDTSAQSPTPSLSYINPGNAIGIVAVGSLLANGTLPGNTDTQVTTNLPITTITGRRYRVSIFIRAMVSTTAASVGVTGVLRDGTIRIPNASGPWVWVPGAGGSGAYSPFVYSWTIDGDGTTKTFNVILNPSGASAPSVSIFSSDQGYFYVEDVGPNSAPALPIPDTPPAWAALPLGSYSAVAGSLVPQYRKIGDVVYLRGNITGGLSGTPGTVMPAGFRPQYVVEMVAFAYNNGWTYVNVTLVPNGNLSWINPPGASTVPNNISLWNVQYSVGL